ncbi:MAG: response regulator receiver protein [Firmicutes bacterium]|nr:response regulator receiver protein [Bacillota bacterium]
MQEVRIVIIDSMRFMRDMLGARVRSIDVFNLIIQANSLEEAIARMEGQKPHIVLLDIDVNSSRPEENIARLLEVYPDVSIICTSHKWDETITRIVIQAGAKGYLVKPFEAEELVAAVKSFNGPRLLPVNEMITILSPKGNCGKTTLAVNLAVGLTQETDHLVGIVEADFAFGDIPVYLNVDPLNTFVEAVRDLKHISTSTLGTYLQTYNKSIKVLTGASRPELAELIDVESFMEIIRMMRKLFRYVIVDNAAGFDKRTLAVAKASDIVYVMAAINSGFEMEHLKYYLNSLRELGCQKEKIKVILSRFKLRGESDYLRQLQDEIGYPIMTLPNQFQLATNALNMGVPFTINDSDSQLAQGILQIVDDIVEKTSSKGHIR